MSAGRGSQSAPPQGNSLSGGKRVGLFVGIAAAVAAIILALTTRDDDDVIEEPCPVNTLSPGGPIPPGCGPIVL